MSHHKLEFRNINFSYPDGNKVLSNVSFTINHGESVGIIGANGVGKSTILMLLMGIYFPISGRVLVGNVNLTKKTLSMIRQRLGMVFQNPDDQLFMTTVFEDVAFGPRNLKLDEDEVKSRVSKALNKVGIQHLSDRESYKLSGGEKRAAAIASILSMEPDVLIMDEPTSALDPKARRRIINLLNKFEHTKIITSHDLDMVLDSCKRTIIIDNGKIVADGATKSILSNGKLLNKCGLEEPLSIRNCPVCGYLK